MNRTFGNIEHSTFNVEHRMIPPNIFDWVLSVECWMLNVFYALNGGRP